MFTKPPPKMRSFTRRRRCAASPAAEDAQLHPPSKMRSFTRRRRCAASPAVEDAQLHPPGISA
jgi:hypothetical protein